MLRGATILALSALVPMAVSQTIQVPPLPFNLTFTPDLNKVPADRRSDWCNGERAVCDTLCGAPDTYPKTNDCDSATLKFACTCQNGTAPGLQYYHNSLPTFICEEAYEQCIAANVGNRSGQDKCKTDVRSQCGQQDAKPGSGGGSSTTSSASAPSPTQSGGSSTQSSGSSNNQPPSSSTPAPKNAAAQAQVPHLAGFAVVAALLGAYAL